MEDNEAVTKILHKGRSNVMRHIHRTHRINCDWLYEIIKHEGIICKYVNTKFQYPEYPNQFKAKRKKLIMNVWRKAQKEDNNFCKQVCSDDIDHDLFDLTLIIKE